MTDGGVTFLPGYLGSFAGDRTVKINIGYRFIEYPVTGIPADYSAVDAAIAKIPADLSIYTEESVAALLAAQQSIIRDLGLNYQGDVDLMAAALEEAIANLKLAPPKPESKPVVQAKKVSPQTADGNDPVIWGAMLIAALIVFAAVTRKRFSGLR